MNHLLRHPVFVLSVIGYFINRFVLKWLHLESLLVPYLNDILCLPIVLTTALWLQRRIFYKNTFGRLAGVQVLFTVSYIALMFELILPFYSQTYTRDYWDVVAYAAGGIIYYFTINPGSAAED